MPDPNQYPFCSKQTWSNKNTLGAACVLFNHPGYKPLLISTKTFSVTLLEHHFANKNFSNERALAMLSAHIEVGLVSFNETWNIDYEELANLFYGVYYGSIPLM